MRHLLVLFFSLPFILAENEFCQQYVECEEKAHAKAIECLTNSNALAEAKAPSKWQGCDEAKALHDEIHDLNEKSRDAKDVCIKEKVSSSDALTGKKAERCAAIAQRVSKRSGNEAAKRKARRSKDPKKAAQKLCWREAKRLQTNCQKLVKCCPLVRQCAKQDENKAALTEKKKLLRESTKQCRAKSAKVTK
ncbi:hypothetical protein WR25_22638 [Diploscapter pachys]|uniref:Uncharacterized protein n=1 Tax=Diploscapter pachys TaxID=2018661 RepID=A0A2A2L777_9BILA|nr:hypothetical protein WR25_22638 [Diploscapter pachys]